jgi:hypothetical protein
MKPVLDDRSSGQHGEKDDEVSVGTAVTNDNDNDNNDGNKSRPNFMGWICRKPRKRNILLPEDRQWLSLFLPEKDDTSLFSFVPP